MSKPTAQRRRRNGRDAGTIVLGPFLTSLGLRLGLRSNLPAAGPAIDDAGGCPRPPAVYEEKTKTMNSTPIAGAAWITKKAATCIAIDEARAETPFSATLASNTLTRRGRERSGKAPAARQGAKANRSKSARHEHANVRAQAGCRGHNIRGGRRPVAVQSGAPVSQGSGHVPFPDRLAVGLRAIDLLQPCFQTLDRTFAVRGPQEEVASCGCIRLRSPNECPTQLA